jgi:hypothetical protein
MSMVARRIHKKERISSGEHEIEVSTRGVKIGISPGVLLIIVVLFTFTSFVGIMVIAFLGPDELTEAQTAVHTTLNTIATAGTGAIIGLLAGSKE